MTQTKTKRDVTLYAIAAWMIINILFMVLLIVNGDVADLSNWIEIALWAISIPALLSTKKWGIAFTLFTLIYTLSTSMGILIYFQIWLNALRVLINLPIIIYLFHSVFQAKFK